MNKSKAHLKFFFDPLRISLPKLKKTWYARRKHARYENSCIECVEVKLSNPEIEANITTHICESGQEE